MSLMIRISCCGYPIPANTRPYANFYLPSRFLEIQFTMTGMSCYLPGCELDDNANRIKFLLFLSTSKERLCQWTMEVSIVPRMLKVVHHRQTEPL